jgi:hypothetical protein
MVVKLAQLCYPLKQIVTAASLDESWDLCRNTLSRMSVYGKVPRRCLESLEAMQQKISHLEQCMLCLTHKFYTVLANMFSSKLETEQPGQTARRSLYE